MNYFNNRTILYFFDILYNYFIYFANYIKTFAYLLKHITKHFMTILKYLTVFLFSMFKFAFGAISGIAAGLSVAETFFFSVLGMMFSVVLFSILSLQVKEYVARRNKDKVKPLFSTKTRKMVRLWNKYGLVGVAFLTPILFSPIVGTMLAVSFGEKRSRIFAYMLMSAIFWGLGISILVNVLGVQLGLIKG